MAIPFNEVPPPIVIQFMLACHCLAHPERDLGPSWDSPAGREARHWLFKRGLISGRNGSTEKGAAWVKMICGTPMPEQRWVNPLTGSEISGLPLSPIAPASQLFNPQGGEEEI